MSQLAEQHKSQALQFEVELRDEEDPYEKEELGVPQEAASPVPSICGLPLKYVSCVLLPSRFSTAIASRAEPTDSYSPLSVRLDL